MNSCIYHVVCMVVAVEQTGQLNDPRVEVKVSKPKYLTLSYHVQLISEDHNPQNIRRIIYMPIICWA